MLEIVQRFPLFDVQNFTPFILQNETIKLVIFFSLETKISKNIELISFYKLRDLRKLFIKIKRENNVKLHNVLQKAQRLCKICTKIEMLQISIHFFDYQTL